jgi:hypothetical protein
LLVHVHAGLATLPHNIHKTFSNLKLIGFSKHPFIGQGEAILVFYWLNSGEKNIAYFETYF